MTNGTNQPAPRVRWGRVGRWTAGVVTAGAIAYGSLAGLSHVSDSEFAQGLPGFKKYDDSSVKRDYDRKIVKNKKDYDSRIQALEKSIKDERLTWDNQRKAISDGHYITGTHNLVDKTGDDKQDKMVTTKDPNNSQFFGSYNDEHESTQAYHERLDSDKKTRADLENELRAVNSDTGRPNFFKDVAPTNNYIPDSIPLPPVPDNNGYKFNTNESNNTQSEAKGILEKFNDKFFGELDELPEPKKPEKKPESILVPKPDKPDAPESPNAPRTPIVKTHPHAGFTNQEIFGPDRFGNLMTKGCYECHVLPNNSPLARWPTRYWDLVVQILPEKINNKQRPNPTGWKPWRSTGDALRWPTN